MEVTALPKQLMPMRTNERLNQEAIKFSESLKALKSEKKLITETLEDLQEISQNIAKRIGGKTKTAFDRRVKVFQVI
jgi:hypothetical protein